jgi:hypothetical protein
LVEARLISHGSPGSIVGFEVTCGDDTQTYIVYKEFACYYSSLLNAAFNSDSDTAKSQAFIDIVKSQTFPIDDGTTFDAFQLLVQWLYCQNIVIKALATDFDESSMKPDICEAAEADESKAIELWILANKFQIPLLQNLAMDKLVELYELYPPTAPKIAYVYENTPADSVLRRFFVKKLADSPNNDMFPCCPEVFPHEFLIELVVFSRTLAEMANGFMLRIIMSPWTSQSIAR